MNPTPATNQRPCAVTSAALIFVISNALTLLLFMAHSPPGRPILFLIRSFFAAALTALFLAPLWFAFQRRNWTRWIIVAMQATALLSFQRALHRVQTRPHWELWNLYFQTGIELLATALLFLPSSNRWFNPQPPTPRPPSTSSASPSSPASPRGT